MSRRDRERASQAPPTLNGASRSGANCLARRSGHTGQPPASTFRKILLRASGFSCGLIRIRRRTAPQRAFAQHRRQLCCPVWKPDQLPELAEPLEGSETCSSSAAESSPSVQQHVQPKGEPGQNSDQIARPTLPCPKLRLMLCPWHARHLNISFSIFQRVRPSHAMSARLSADFDAGEERVAVVALAVCTISTQTRAPHRHWRRPTGRCSSGSG